jgi:hypothetical protein
MAENLPATRPRGGPPAALAGRQKVGVNVPPEVRGLRIPILQVIHKIETQEDFKAGKRPGWFTYGKNTVIEKPRVVFLKVDHGRRYATKNDRDQVRTLCGSGNGIVPLPQVPKPPSKTCAACPFGQWETSETEINPRTGEHKRIPPDCDEGRVFLGILLDRDGAPLWYPNFNTARPPCDEFINRFSMDPDVSALHQWVVELSTRPEKTGFTWYLPVFTVVEVLPLERNAKLYEAAKELVWAPLLNRGGGRAVEEPELRDDHVDDVPPPTDDDIPF